MLEESISPEGLESSESQSTQDFPVESSNSLVPEQAPVVPPVQPEPYKEQEVVESAEIEEVRNELAEESIVETSDVIDIEELQSLHGRELYDYMVTHLKSAHRKILDHEDPRKKISPDPRQSIIVHRYTKMSDQNLRTIEPSITYSAASRSGAIPWEDALRNQIIRDSYDSWTLYLLKQVRDHVNNNDSRSTESPFISFAEPIKKSNKSYGNGLIQANLPSELLISVVDWAEKDRIPLTNISMSGIWDEEEMLYIGGPLPAASQKLIDWEEPRSYRDGQAAIAESLSTPEPVQTPIPNQSLKGKSKKVFSAIVNWMFGTKFNP